MVQGRRASLTIAVNREGVCLAADLWGMRHFPVAARAGQLKVSGRMGGCRTATEKYESATRIGYDFVPGL
jgi:hypothetical protein